MLIFENIALAISGLWSNKMRALLTMLGIIIGISSVIGIVTVGNSVTQGMNQEMQSLGANNISVYVQQKPKEEEITADGDTAMEMGMYSDIASTWVSPESSDYISEEMIAKLKGEFGEKIKYVSTQESLSASKAKNGRFQGDISTSGVNIDYLGANNVELIQGRYLNEEDIEKARRVCIISNSLSNSLFNGADPIGKTLDIEINKNIETFYVVGVYRYKSGTGLMSFGNTSSTPLYVPISTAKRINNSAAEYQDITVVGGVGQDSNLLSAQIDSFFDREYAHNRNFTAKSFNMQSMVESTTKMLKTISLAISVIAGISLLVGGIGVMNIMLVSITERTREIGTRKALGATNNSIRLQFIVESILICLIGGIIGIIFGIAFGSIGAKLVGYSAHPSVSTIAIAVSFSMAIGVFFGYYPANKAAKLDPIEALRYE